MTTRSILLANDYCALVGPHQRSTTFVILGPVPAPGQLRPTVAAGTFDPTTRACVVTYGVASLEQLAELEQLLNATTAQAATADELERMHALSKQLADAVARQGYGCVLIISSPLHAARRTHWPVWAGVSSDPQGLLAEIDTTTPEGLAKTEASYRLLSGIIGAAGDMAKTCEALLDDMRGKLRAIGYDVNPQPLPQTPAESPTTSTEH